MKLSTFLEEQLQLNLPTQTLTALDGLAGEEIHETYFYADMEEVEEWCLSWMPLYVLPIAKEGFHWIGLHLTPENIAAKRLPIVRIDDADVYEFARIAEVAPSLSGYLRRLLLQEEALFNEEWLETTVKPAERDFEAEMGASLSLLRDLFGADFYTPGQRDFYIATDEDETKAEFLFSDPQEIMIESFGGSPFDYAEQIWYLPEGAVTAKLRLVEEACHKFPACFSLQATRAELYHQQENLSAAVEAVEAALRCYHHTAYHHQPKTVYALGRKLLHQQPEAFSPFATEALTERGDVPHFKWLTSFVQAGQPERTIKLLHDLCFDWRSFDTPYILDFFSYLYNRGGWKWAVSLCKLHYPAPQATEWPRVSPQQADLWQEMVSNYLNLK